MTRADNPRIETPHEAHVREQAEALERQCTRHRCRAKPGEHCVNPETGNFYTGFLSHLERMQR